MATKLFTIYAIFCTVTRQRYVGKTLQPSRRKTNHFGLLRAGKRHSPKLQQDFNLYGESAFEWRVLEDGISPKKADKKERHWIAYFDSFKNGYNMNDGTSKPQPPKPCTWNGIQYPSITAAAEALGISRPAMKFRLMQGHSQDSDVGQYFPNDPKPVSWNGVEYESISAAARALGISTQAMQERVARERVCDDDLRKPNPVVWNGKQYESASAAAVAIGVNFTTLISRLTMGYTCDDDLRPILRPVTWNGIQYESLTHAAQALGISPATLHGRLSKGYTKDSDVKPFRKPRPITIDGKQYESIKAASIELGISQRQVIKLAQRRFRPDSE